MTKPRVLAILQARLSSTRLPGKVMRPLLGEPMVWRQWERICRAKLIDRLVLATSDDPSDDPLAAFAAARGMACFRGSLPDVLARFAGAAEAFGPTDHIVRLTADCPLCDPAIIDAVIAHHLQSGADYTSNSVERTFADGLDVEVMTSATLFRAAAEAPPGPAREHVTMHIYRHPAQFRLAALTQGKDQSHWRWTVDTPEDFAMVSRVYQALYPQDPAFDAADVETFLCAHPDVAALNKALG